MPAPKFNCSPVHRSKRRPANAGAFTVSCVGNKPQTIWVHAEGFADAEATGRAGASITVHLRIADVHTVVEVGKDSGASVDTDHGAGTHTLSARRYRKGMADDPDDFKRQLQILAASSGGAPGQAILTVDGFQNGSTRCRPKSSIASIRVNPDMFSSEYDHAALSAEAE